MARAFLESWPDGPESRAYTADGDVNQPRGWQPPAPEHRERIARFFALRDSGWTGGIDRDGHAVMSRTDSRGRPLPLFRGGTGTGTPDERAARAAGERRRERSTR